MIPLVENIGTVFAPFRIVPDSFWKVCVSASSPPGAIFHAPSTLAGTIQ